MTQTIQRPQSTPSTDTPRLVPLKPSPFNAESAVPALGDDLTPTPSFYVRSNFAVPSPDPAAFRLRVEGEVRQSVELSIDDLKALGSRTIATVMECAGNNRLQLAPLPSGEPWHAGAVSAGQWTGAPLGAVLDRAGVKDGVIEILFEGADHGKPKDGPRSGGASGEALTIPFARSLPLEKALHEDTLLVYAMNGQPLPRDHGAPLRLVVPRWYGMASVKWLHRIQALAEPFTGYYQKNRYIYSLAGGAAPTPVTTMRVKALIVTPDEGATIPQGPYTVRGKAWSGEGEIVKVEVGVDGGDDWREARLLPSSGPYTWRAWEYDWNADVPGRRALRARATDSQGNVQPDAPTWNKYGYGNNAVRPVIFTVEG